METSVDPPIWAERRSWVGKRLMDTEAHGRTVGADDVPVHGVIAVVRRDPSRSVVNRVLREHLETFLTRFTDELHRRSRQMRPVVVGSNPAS